MKNIEKYIILVISTIAVGTIATAIYFAINRTNEQTENYKVVVENDEEIEKIIPTREKYINYINKEDNIIFDGYLDNGKFYYYFRSYDEIEWHNSQIGNGSEYVALSNPNNILRIKGFSSFDNKNGVYQYFLFITEDGKVFYLTIDCFINNNCVFKKYFLFEDYEIEDINYFDITNGGAIIYEAVLKDGSIITDGYPDNMSGPN